MAFLTEAANRGSIATGYEIDNSCKFEIDNSESIVTTNQAAGNQKTWTWSGWLKRTELDGTQAFFGAGGTYIRFVSGNELNVQQSGTALTTNQVFRDTSAWYHVVWILDTTQATEADRSRIYINGSQITSFSAATYPSQNADLDVGGLGSSSNWLQLGRWYAGGRRYSGYIAEVHYLNGTVAEPTEFGEYDDDSGIWIPKKYTGGGYGTQGYYYKFDNSSNLGEDSSGEGHDANSLNNITAADQATDTPTNNFATMNPLWNYYNEVPRVTISDGGTRLTGNQSSTIWRGIPSTIPVTAGKWYWEVERGYNGNGIMVGYGSTENIGWRELSTVPGSGSGKMLYSLNGDIYGYDADEDNRTQYAGNFNTIGDIVSIALDVDNGWAYTRYNGAAWHSSGNPSSGSTGTGAISIPWSPEEPTVFVVTIPNNNQDTRVNFGGYTTTANTLSYSDSNNYGAFKYEVPSGYYALCTKNLAEYG